MSGAGVVAGVVAGVSNGGAPSVPVTSGGEYKSWKAFEERVKEIRKLANLAFGILAPGLLLMGALSFPVCVIIQVSTQVPQTLIISAFLCMIGHTFTSAKEEGRARFQRRANLSLEESRVMCVPRVGRGFKNRGSTCYANAGLQVAMDLFPPCLSDLPDSLKCIQEANPAWFEPSGVFVDLPLPELQELLQELEKTNPDLAKKFAKLKEVPSKKVKKHFKEIAGQLSKERAESLEKKLIIKKKSKALERLKNVSEFIQSYRRSTTPEGIIQDLSEKELYKFLQTKENGILLSEKMEIDLDLQPDLVKEQLQEKASKLSDEVIKRLPIKLAGLGGDLIYLEEFIHENRPGQQDAHEFLMELLNRMEEDYKEVVGETLWDFNSLRIATEVYQTVDTVDEEGNVKKEKHLLNDPSTRSPEKYKSLCLDLKEGEEEEEEEKETLSQRVEAYFSPTEIEEYISEKRKVDNEEFGNLFEGNKAYSQFVIEGDELPEKLIIRLKRFDANRQKNDYKVASPLHFSFPEKGNVFYGLDSFVYHRGNIGSGHYVTYKRVWNKTQYEYYCFDDERIEKVTLEVFEKEAESLYFGVYSKS